MFIFNKWSPSKQFNYFINFGSTPSKIQFHLHSLFLFLHCKNLYPYNHRSIRFHCQRVFLDIHSSSTNSSKETGLETSYLNPIAYRTHCGRLLVHFQWITFYERSDKWRMTVGGGDLTNAIDESCRWKRRSFFIAGVEEILSSNGTDTASFSFSWKSFYTGVSIRKYPLLIDVTLSRMLNDLGQNSPEGLLKGRIKFR